MKTAQRNLDVWHIAVGVGLYCITLYTSVITRTAMPELSGMLSLANWLADSVTYFACSLLCLKGWRLLFGFSNLVALQIALYAIVFGLGNHFFSVWEWSKLTTDTAEALELQLRCLELGGFAVSRFMFVAIIVCVEISVERRSERI